MKRICNDKGSALIISLLLMGMLTLLALMAVKSSNTDIDLTFNHINGDKSLYIAEAGARRAFAEINSDNDWRTGYSSIQFNNGTYTVQVIDSSTNAALDDTVLIHANGWVMGAQTNIELTLVPLENNPFRYALFADDDVELRNSMNTDSYNSDSGSYAGTQMNLYGDVGSNGTITLKNGASVGGDVTTSSDSTALVINPGSSVAGNVNHDVPENTVDPLPQSDFDYAAANNDNATGIYGTYSIDPSTGDFESNGTVTFTDGTYYFPSFTLKNSAELVIASGADVTIYVTGDIEIKNSGDLNSDGDPSDLMFLSQGDIILKNSGEIYGVFYNPEGDADLRNSSDFYGSIVANTILVHNSAEFHYDRNLGNMTFGSSLGYAAIGWREM